MAEDDVERIAGTDKSARNAEDAKFVNKIHAASRRIAAAGLPIVPIVNGIIGGGTLPLLSGEFAQGTTKPETIDQWFQEDRSAERIAEAEEKLDHLLAQYAIAPIPKIKEDISTKIYITEERLKEEPFTIIGVAIQIPDQNLCVLTTKEGSVLPRALPETVSFGSNAGTHYIFKASEECPGETVAEGVEFESASYVIVPLDLKLRAIAQLPEWVSDYCWGKDCRGGKFDTPEACATAKEACLKADPEADHRLTREELDECRQLWLGEGINEQKYESGSKSWDDMNQCMTRPESSRRIVYTLDLAGCALFF
jgi:hypothetical protein